MDWFSWLSKTVLEPCLVYEYSLAFSHNELEEDDIPYFNHEFLQSMGISIAKRRLEILKLSRKAENGGGSPRPRPTMSMSRLLLAIKTSKRSLFKYLRTWIHPDHSLSSSSSSSASESAPLVGYGSRWRGARLKRNKTVKTHHQPRLLLRNSTIPGPMRSTHSFTSPVKMDGDDDDDGYWSTGVEGIRWDTMFQDLKPT